MSATEAFLRGFHREHPGVTSAGLGVGRLPDGRSSYRLLADAVPGGGRVLDLACGDGALLALLPDGAVGADLAEGELAAARRRVPNPLVQARAQRLPFTAGSFDACTSHMAFMLFDEPESAAREVARVLRPGGTFALVVGGGGDGDVFRGFLDVARPRLAAIPRLGDRRTRTEDGLAEILRPAGFAEPTWTRHPLDLSGPPAHVWQVLSTLYDVAPLPPAELAALRTDFLATLPPSGTHALGFTLNLAVTRLR